jgi:hypothetical protein
LVARACSVNRGRLLRRSESAKAVELSIVPVRKPLPSGLNGTRPMAELEQGRQDLGFGLAPPERVFAL